MKKLLLAASMAAGLAAGAVPAFAQSATTSQPGSTASAHTGAAGPVQAQNYYGAQDPVANQTHDRVSYGAHIGGGSDSSYLTQQQELQHMPGYNIAGD